MITPETAPQEQDQEQQRAQQSSLQRTQRGSRAPTGEAVGSPMRRVWSLLNAGGRSNRWPVNLLLWLGAALVLASAAIHLHLWSTGYRHIATIGPLFLLQGIAGIVLAVVLAVTRRVWSIVAAAGFLAGTVAGFLVSVNVGLFGFQDTWVAPTAKAAFAVEVAGFAILVMGAGLCLARHSEPSRG